MPPRPSKLRPPLTGYTAYGIHLINWCISFHSCQVLSPSKTGFTVSAHRLTNITLLMTFILNEDTQRVIRAIGVSRTACKNMIFDEIFDLTAGVYFYSYNVPLPAVFYFVTTQCVTARPVLVPLLCFVSLHDHRPRRLVPNPDDNVRTPGRYYY